MRQHQVNQNLQAQIMRLFNQRIEITQCPEHRIDIAVIRDIIAEIKHGGFKEWRDPNRVHPKACDMIKAVNDPRQIANPIIIAVLIAARVDLIDHRTTPPILINAKDIVGVNFRHDCHLYLSFYRASQKATHQVTL